MELWVKLDLMSIKCSAIVRKNKNHKSNVSHVQIETEQTSNIWVQWTAVYEEHSPLLLLPLSLLLLLLYSGQTASLCQQSGCLLGICGPTHAPSCGRARRLCWGGWRDTKNIKKQFKRFQKAFKQHYSFINAQLRGPSHQSSAGKTCWYMYRYRKESQEHLWLCFHSMCTLQILWRGSVWHVELNLLVLLFSSTFRVYHSPELCWIWPKEISPSPGGILTTITVPWIQSTSIKNW